MGCQRSVKQRVEGIKGMLHADVHKHIESGVVHCVGLEWKCVYVGLNICACMYVCSVCMYMYMFVRMFVCTYADTYASVYLCTCIYVCTCCMYSTQCAFMNISANKKDMQNTQYIRPE